MDDDDFAAIMEQAKAHDRSVAGGSKKRERVEPVTEQGQLQKKLDAGIAPSNKGFKLLQQMGFSGTIGKTNAKAQEPLPMVQRARNEGLGADSEAKRVVREIRTAEQVTEQQYVARQAAEKLWGLRRKQLRAAEKISRELDEKAGVEETKKEEQNNEGEDDIEEVIPDLPQLQQQLEEAVEQLRARHHYCFYCAALFASDEELREHCPGPAEEDH
jgi:hypothetical protein